MGRIVSVCMWSLLAIAGAANATQTFTVNSSLDELDTDVSDGVCRSPSGVCTLRAAIMQANAFTGPGVVINLPPGIYAITRPIDSAHPGNGGSLFLDAPPDGVTPISIVGTDTDSTVIDGSQIDRVFVIAVGRTATFSSLTVRNGQLLTDSGGGILNKGTLTLDHVAVTGNHAKAGGGIENEFAATLHIVSSSIATNVADISGGGVYSIGPLDVVASTFAFNDANRGGGLFLIGNSLLVNTTIAENRASDDGGGIVVNLEDSVANMYNSTIAFNFADSDGNNVGSGGGLNSDSPAFNIYNTLIAGNYHINPAFADDCDGLVRTHAYNRFGNTSQCNIVQVSGAYALLNSVDDLGSLQDNGGPTQTVALLAGSNAIGGAAATCLDSNSNPITTDQRGFPRNVGNCDIGAYEFGATDPNDKIFNDGFDRVAGK
jgi:hypothetical protein